MASSRDDFIIAIRSAFLKKSTQQKQSEKYKRIYASFEKMKSGSIYTEKFSLQIR